MDLGSLVGLNRIRESWYLSRLLVVCCCGFLSLVTWCWLRWFGVNSLYSLPTYTRLYLEGLRAGRYVYPVYEIEQLDLSQ